MNKLLISISDTEESLQKGLMFVSDLPENEGMLFVFNRDQNLSFWGYNTYIPLDIAFLDSNFQIKKISHINPLSLKSIKSDYICKYAIEANYGYFKKNKINVGDYALVKKDKDINYVLFSSLPDKIAQSTNNNDNNPDPLIDQLDKIDNNKDSNNSDSSLPTLSEKDLDLKLEDDLEDINRGIIPADPNDSLEKTKEEKDKRSKETENNVPNKDLNQYPKFSNIFEAIDWANINNECIRISYTTLKGIGIVRNVEPHGRYHSKGTNREILVTFDENMQDIRAFIVKNIKIYSFLGKKFNKKFNFV